MNKIKTWEELIALPNSSKLYKIYNGNIETFIVVGQIKQSKGLIVANNDSLKDLRFIYERDFDIERIVYSTEYDSAIVGNIMISQIKANAMKDVEAIASVYLIDIENITIQPICKSCNEVYSQKEVERIFGIESSPAKLGFCSSRCYTLNLMKNNPPE